ncbi:MAG: RNA polymerase sigma factor [Pseudomonadota bacterium]
MLDIFIKHEAGLRRLLWRYVSNRQDVEDLLQETYVRVLAADAKYKLRASKGYLFRTAKNLALNELAKKSRTTTDSIEDSTPETVLIDEGQIAADESLSTRQEFMLVAQAVAGLPPQCRKVVVMRKFDGLSYREIADRLGITVSTAEKHAATGLIKCVDHLRRNGHDVEEMMVRLGAKRRAPSSTGSGEKPNRPQTDSRILRKKAASVAAETVKIDDE